MRITPLSRLLGCVVPLALTACSHAPTKPVVAAKPAAAPAPSPNDVRQREASGLAPVAVNSADGKLQLTVDAKGTPTIEPIAANSYLLKIPIGSEIEVLCRVGEAEDLAAATMELRKGVEKLPKREFSAIDAGELAGAAFLSTRTLYVLEKDGKSLYGEVKTL